MEHKVPKTPWESWQMVRPDGDPKEDRNIVCRQEYGKNLEN